MTEIEFLHEMVKAAGGDVNALNDRLKSTYYECLINCMKNGGGSSGGSGEYTQPEWGFKETPMLNETKVTYVYNSAVNASVAMLDPSLLSGELEDGAAYAVYYNGVKYACVCANEMLGNGVILGYDNTGEPFCMGMMSGVLMIAPVNQTETEATVSVKRVVYKRIEENYLQYIPYVDLAEAGLPAINNEGSVSLKCDENIQKEILKAYEHGAIRFKIKANFNISEMTKLSESDNVVVTAQSSYAKYDSYGRMNFIEAECILFGRLIKFTLYYDTLTVTYKKLADG